MANVIVGIHGLANKPPKNIEADWWEKAIREGLKVNCSISVADFEFHMVYWADLLYPQPLGADNEEPYRPAEAGTLKKYKESSLDEARKLLGIPVGKAGDVLAKLEESVGLGTAANDLLRTKLSDLARYYDLDDRITPRQIQGQPPSAPVSTRKVLMNELNNALLLVKGRRIMLIGHSMGSIIAYDVLRDLGETNPNFEVAHFVTIGSPLGLPYVKARIYQEHSDRPGEPVRTPTIVTGRWVNYADRKDPVAVDIVLRDDYGPNRRGIRVEDELVLNDYPLPAGKPNHHKSYGYLRTPEISEHIRQFI